MYPQLSDSQLEKLADMIVARLTSIDLGASGLLEGIITRATEQALKNALDSVNGKIDLWVKPEEYRKRYALSAATLHRYAVAGKITRQAIRGEGKSRRYNISIPPCLH